jgi:CTP:molybdopterin cytidylyltransferase MocA
MARAYGVTHKCMLPIAGRTMLGRVLDALSTTRRFHRIQVSIETEDLLRTAAAPLPEAVSFAPARESASASAIEAFRRRPFERPTLVTTGDHPLLTQEMIEHFLAAAASSGADLNVGLAAETVIAAAYPEARRTYLSFGSDRVSGCNLFALNSAAAPKVLNHWRYVEQNRKKPWRLVGSFGLVPLVRYAVGRLTLEGAFSAVSRTLQLDVRPVLMPFAEAAIDVDKPEDLELAERILARR